MQKDDVNHSNLHLNFVSEWKDSDSLLGSTKNISQFFKRALVFFSQIDIIHKVKVLLSYKHTCSGLDQSYLNDN